MRLQKILLSFMMLVLGWSVNGQDLAYSGNPDTSFFTARDLAFAGHRTVARDTLNHILTEYPEYTDVRSLLAKTLSWDGKYDEARKHFNRITSEERKNKEVWTAAIKNEIYAKEFYIALGLTNKALSFLDGDEDLLQLKSEITSQVYAKTESVEETRKYYNRITSKDRGNRKAWISAIKNEINAEEYYVALGLANKALSFLKDDDDLKVMKAYASMKINQQHGKDDLDGVELPEKEVKEEEKTKNNQVTISNTFDVFDKVFDPMIYTSIEYKRETKAGSIIPRINYANRFQTHGIQYEVDFYPKFSKTFYGYLNYGYSSSPIFPDHRVGGELYANFAKKYEASAGFRYLDFADANAIIYTGSFGLYSGNYYFSLRPYVTPNPNGDLGASGEILARKYLKDANNYLGLRAGMGFLPELRQLRFGDELIAETLLYVESQQLQFEYQFTGWVNSNSYRANLGVLRQELFFDSDNFYWAVSAGITAQVRF